jgi:hypothetical protein
MNWKANEKLAGNMNFLNSLEAAEEPAAIAARFAAETEGFRIKRAGFLLY